MMRWVAVFLLVLVACKDDEATKAEQRREARRENRRQAQRQGDRLAVESEASFAAFVMRYLRTGPLEHQGARWECFPSQARKACSGIGNRRVDCELAGTGRAVRDGADAEFRFRATFEAPDFGCRRAKVSPVYVDITEAHLDGAEACAWVTSVCGSSEAPSSSNAWAEPLKSYLEPDDLQLESNLQKKMAERRQKLKEQNAAYVDFVNTRFPRARSVHDAVEGCVIDAPVECRNETECDFFGSIRVATEGADELLYFSATFAFPDFRPTRLRAHRGIEAVATFDDNIEEAEAWAAIEEHCAAASE